jgi:hypothetical protein
MASHSLNDCAIAHARRLIDARQYVLDSDWRDVQPRARDENAFLKAHTWDEYADWHLGLIQDATDETKSRFAFVYPVTLTTFQPHGVTSHTAVVHRGLRLGRSGGRMAFRQKG